jgi:SAM-dependent methyltransferase
MTTAAALLEDTHRIEVDKWDAIAATLVDDARRPLPYADLRDYMRWSPGLRGAADVLGDLRAKRVLELGCGTGQLTTMLALAGAEVFAFDLSPRSTELTRMRLEAHGVHADVRVVAGEAMPYDNAAFDVVIGESVLHHIEPVAGSAELARVARPGAIGVFAEPLGMNPLLRFAREHVPYRSKAPRGADVPLSYDDIARWGSGFSEVRTREVQLLSMFERFFGYDRELALLRRADDYLLARSAVARRMCRYGAITMVR